MENAVSCSELKMGEPIYDHTFKGIGVRGVTEKHIPHHSGVQRPYVPHRTDAE